jgi:hypothetical protein
MKTDSQIQQDVIDELRWEPPVDAIEIGVEVKNGIVTLAGHVSNTHQVIFLKVLTAYVHCYCRLPCDRVCGHGNQPTHLRAVLIVTNRREHLVNA